MTYIIIKSKVIDLSSKIDLIKAFSTEYMQESPDGCLISETYLSLIASFLNVKSLDNNKLEEPGYKMQNNSINDSLCEEDTGN